MQPRFWSFRLFAALWGVLFAPLAPALADAFDVAQRVPGDALVYVGWSQVLGEEEGSLLDLLPTLASRFGAGSDELGTLHRIARLGRMAMTRSGGAALFDAGAAGDDQPSLGLVLIVRAGDDAEPFTGTFGELISESQDFDVRTVTIGGRAFSMAEGPAGFRLLWGNVNGEVVLVAGSDPEALYRSRIAVLREPLAANPVFRSCRAKLARAEGSTVCAFANARRLVELAKSVMDASPLGVPPKLDKILDEVGVSAVQALCLEAGPSDLGTRVQVFVKTEGARKGLLKPWDCPPLDEQSLRLIPEDAAAATAFNLDLAALWTEARRAIEAVDPNAALHVDSALAGVSAMLGFSPTEQFLPAFGDTWVVFDAPDHGGFLITGIVLVAEIRNREALSGALERVMGMVAPFAEHANVRPVLGVTERGGHTIHYLVLAGWPSPIVPAVCFIGDYAVFGLTPQAVAVAAKQVDPKTRAGSILDHPDVIAARKRLPPRLQSFFYSDSRAAARSSYRLVNLISAAVASAAAPDMADPGLMPTLPESLAGVKSGVGGATADEDGLLYTSYGNVIPLAAPGDQMASVAVIALLISILLPSLSRARELAKRAVSASNLRAIGQGLHIYANDHGEKFPDSLEALIEEGMITRETLNSPRDREGAISYVYISGQSETNASRNVVAYEKIIGHEGTNVLFLDGHVEWMRPQQFKQALLDTYLRLEREDEMPDDLRP